MSKDQSNHYIDNKKFLEAMREYITEYRLAKANNEELPRVTEYIGSCFLLIAERLSMRHNFARYTFRDEMVSDAVENCLMYIYNFDPDVSNNPFGYFTLIAFRAFVRRIKKENRQVEIKNKYIMSLDVDEFLNSLSQNHDDTEYKNTVLEFLRSQNIDATDLLVESSKKKEV
jgi:hypothetical protein